MSYDPYAFLRGRPEWDNGLLAIINRAAEQSEYWESKGLRGKEHSATDLWFDNSALLTLCNRLAGELKATEKER